MTEPLPHDQLVAWLRQVGEPHAAQAADAIEALVKERDEARARVQELKAEAESLDDQIHHIRMGRER